MELVQAAAIIASAAIFLAVIDLIRRNLLKERYSLIWLVASVVLMVFSVWRGLLHFIAAVVGVYYPPSFLFLLAICFLLVLLLHFSVVLSALSERNNRLAQEVGMLKTAVRSLQDKDVFGETGGK